MLFRFLHFFFRDASEAADVFGCQGRVKDNSSYRSLDTYESCFIQEQLSEFCRDEKATTQVILDRRLQQRCRYRFRSEQSEWSDHIQCQCGHNSAEGQQ